MPRMLPPLCLALLGLALGGCGQRFADDAEFRTYVMTLKLEELSTAAAVERLQGSDLGFACELRERPPLPPSMNCRRQYEGLYCEQTHIIRLRDNPDTGKAVVTPGLRTTCT